MSLRAHIRRWYWRHVRRHDGECCHACGAAVAQGCPSYWSAPDWLWREVVGGEAGLRCIRCFTLESWRAGYTVRWAAVPEQRPRTGDTSPSGGSPS